MKIQFCWQGVSGKYGIWKDGLYEAMKIIEKTHQVSYIEPWDKIDPEALILYWESPITILGKDSKNWKRIQGMSNKKALLFSGGPIKKEWLNGFDHVFYESKINGDELRDLGISCSVAFGINADAFHPMQCQKIFDGIHHGTCASWKRQWLLGEALREKGCVVGRYQDFDRRPFDDCKKFKCNVMDEKSPEELNVLINSSVCLVQTSAKDGGGQRATLEALACNIPVICMIDSPKNREYVEESGCGMVINPAIEDIRKAVEEVKITDYGTKGRDYVMKYWTAEIYAENILKWINQK